MEYFSTEQWVALSAIFAAGILTILHVLARQFEHVREVHDLRIRASALRRDYAARMAALREAEGESSAAEATPPAPAVAGTITHEPAPVVVAA